MTQAFNLALLANKVNSSGQLNADTGLYNSPIPSGSVFLLYQSAAPTGWTQVTTLNDYALRIVSGTGGSTGGTTAFSTVFSNQTPTITNTLSVGATTLSTAQMPNHTHSISNWQNVFGCGGQVNITRGGDQVTTAVTTNDAGGGGSHTHGLTGSVTASAITLNVRYANIILCSKN